MQTFVFLFHSSCCKHTTHKPYRPYVVYFHLKKKKIHVIQQKYLELTFNARARMGHKYMCLSKTAYAPRLRRLLLFAKRSMRIVLCIGSVLITLHTHGRMQTICTHTHTHICWHYTIYQCCMWVYLFAHVRPSTSLRCRCRANAVYITAKLHVHISKVIRVYLFCNNTWRRCMVCVVWLLLVW